MTFALTVVCNAGRDQERGLYTACGRTASFTADGPTLAVRVAAAAGWAVDDPMVGPFSRADECPGHGFRPHFWEPALISQSQVAAA